MNTFGNIFRLTTFGESHGPAIGGIIDGMPAGVDIDFDLLHADLEKRRPGKDTICSARNEADNVEILSGVFENKSLGTPIGFIIRNNDMRHQDYDAIKNAYRPSHADFTYQEKYGIRDYRGGGRASARETACRVVGGAFAKMILKSLNIVIKAEIENYDEWRKSVSEAQQDGDTFGGIVKCNISGCPIGLGEPVFNKLHAALGAAMLSINAVKAFEYGEGFRAASMRGSEHNDYFIEENEKLKLATNHSGGILGGISNGKDIYFRVAFKPIATLPKEFSGRHDSSPVARAVPIVEAMASMVIADYYLLNRNSKI
ncbi:MAG: chorismate synthase [Prevotellaceae bacterium]|nr:chorismate synthase [Candidatus Colivivens equi]